MSKKLNRTEIATLAKKILEEVNEVNKVYNEGIINSPAYKAEIERINNQDPLKSIKDKFEKELKIAFGTNFNEEISFDLGSRWSSKLRETQEQIQDEIDTYNEKVLKPILKLCNHQQRIIDDITIAQIDTTDVQMLINIIKAKLI